MIQQTLFPIPNATKVINVSSVPQRSPFRYPGGKTWLVPYIRLWLTHGNCIPTAFIEPFAGGGIISLTVSAERLARHVTMVELDEDVAAVWQTIFSDRAEWLARRIIEFVLTVENVATELDCPPTSKHARAFQTILRNRVNHGGILAAGAGRLKHGEAGKGIASRWYPETLSRRILEASNLSDRLTFVQGDAFDTVKTFSKRDDAVYFFDPPYTASAKKAGSRLYRHPNIDHHKLFSVVEKLQGDFLMTYDNDEAVRKLAHDHGLKMRTVKMKNTHHTEQTELLIGRDFGWLDDRMAVSEISVQDSASKWSVPTKIPNRAGSGVKAAIPSRFRES